MDKKAIVKVTALKVVGLISNLGSGGAERQLCTLAVELKRRGHDVEVITYAPGDFFLPMLQKEGVGHIFLGGNGTLDWLRKIWGCLRTIRKDVVLAFLESSSHYAELAGLPQREWGLVVSERNAVPNDIRGPSKVKKFLHLLADVVTTNSHTNRLMLEGTIPLLKGRIITIYNAVDLDKFKPGDKPTKSKAVRLLVAARINGQKNILRTIEAMAIVRRKTRPGRIILEWFGNSRDDRELWCRCMDLIKQRKLEDCFRIHDPTTSILDQYRKADAVLLPSLYEGLPNTICEAMACGKPILISAVCDAGNLVKNKWNGFSFSPIDSADIAEAILSFASLREAERSEMGERSRELAEQYFPLSKIANMYDIILQAASRRQRPECGHWIPQVPDTALEYKKLSTD